MRKSMIPWTGHTTLGPWDIRTPRLFDRFRHEMDHLFEQVFGEEGDERRMITAPRLNVAETDDHYEISVDLPGMKMDDLNVELKENELWITGERKIEEEEEGKTFHRVERSYGCFRRVVPFDEAVNPDKVDAEYKDGVLHIVVAKDEAVHPKKIDVKTEPHE